MKRRRIVFPVLSTLSALLCAASIFLFVRARSSGFEEVGICIPHLVFVTWSLEPSWPTRRQYLYSRVIFGWPKDTHRGLIWFERPGYVPEPSIPGDVKSEGDFPVYFRLQRSTTILREDGTVRWGWEDNDDRYRYAPKMWDVTVGMRTVYWIAAFAVLPIVFVGNVYRRSRRKYPPGTVPCENCGYDLRASKDVCPECGAAIVPTNTRSNRS